MATSRSKQGSRLRNELLLHPIRGHKNPLDLSELQKNSLILTGNDNYSYDNLTPPTAGISDRLFSSVSHIELFSVKLTGNNNIHFIKKKTPL